MLTLYLGRGLADGCVTLQLPATPADIGEAFAALDNISTDAGATLIVAHDKSSLAPEGRSIVFELNPDTGFAWRGVLRYLHG